MIAKAVIEILLGDAELVAMVGNRIYPIIDVPQVAENTKLKAIYYSVAMYPQGVKNADVAVNHTLTFLTVASGYLESWELSMALRKALEGKKGEFAGVTFRLDRCKSVEDEVEFVPGNMYGQKVMFEVRTAYY